MLPETFNVLIAPVEMLVGALNSHQSLQRYKILFICGLSSSWLDRNFTELEISRAFTSFQLMTILEEMVEYISQALKQSSSEGPCQSRSEDARSPENTGGNDTE